MSIKFEKVSNSYIIPVPKFKEHKSKIPAHLPQGNCLVIAPSNSGKSCLIINLLLRKSFGYLQEYDKVYLISPTIHMDDSYKILHNHIEKERLKREKKYKALIRQKVKRQHIPPELYPENDQIILYDRYDESYIESILNNKPQDEKILFILDDCVCEMKSSSQRSIMDLVFLRGRHQGVFAFIASQKYSAVSLKIRINSPSYIIFKVNNKELERIASELENESIEKFHKVYNACTKEKYSFMYIDIKSDHRYSKCFTHKLLKEKNII